ncbi:MAG: aminotransferase, partial [Burkholderiales bacterium PBB4]
SYFPILVTEDYPISRDELYEKLRSSGIMARRYFYPLVTNFDVYKEFLPAGSHFPVAENVAARVLCLPIYPGMSEDDVRRVVSVIGY